MKKSWFTRIVVVIILAAFPLSFYFYYKYKIDNLSHEADKLQVFWEAPAFRYATQDRDSLSSDSLKGNVYIADFIFTSCGSVCPNLSKTMAQIQDNFKDNSKVKLISFSIDPDRDSIPVLKEYSTRYGAIPGKWFFLRGDKETVWSMAEKGFKIPVVYTPQRGKGNEFTHTERLAVVDGKGEIRGFYNGLDEHEVSQLYDDVSTLLVSMTRK